MHLEREAIGDLVVGQGDVVFVDCIPFFEDDLCGGGEEYEVDRVSVSMLDWYATRWMHLKEDEYSWMGRGA